MRFEARGLDVDHIAPGRDFVEPRFAALRQIWATLLPLQVAQGRTEEAFTTAERCRARVLADVLTGVDPGAEYHGSRTATKLKVAGVDVAVMGTSTPERDDDEFLVRAQFQLML